VCDVYRHNSVPVFNTPFAEKIGDSHVIYDADGTLGIALYGAASGSVNYYVGDQHIFENNAGTPVFNSDASGHVHAVAWFDAPQIAVNGAAALGGDSSVLSILDKGGHQALAIYTTITYYQNDTHLFRSHADAPWFQIGPSSVISNLPFDSLAVTGASTLNGTVSANTIVATTLNCTGVTTSTNYFYAVGNGFYTLDVIGSSQFHIYTSGTSSFINFISGYYLEYRGANGQLTWFAGGAEFWVNRIGDNLCYNSRGPVAGFGAYQNLSDRRGKTAIAPTTKGLAELIQLNPVEFDRVKPAPPDATLPPEMTVRPKELGFVAQEVLDILPEAVWVAAIELPDGSGGADDPNPSLSVTYDTLVTCLVNAVKELNTRVIALEGV
jgi:hypothetical protein